MAKVLVLKRIPGGNPGDFLENVDGRLDHHIAAGNVLPVHPAGEHAVEVTPDPVAVEVEPSNGLLGKLFGSNSAPADPLHYDGDALDGDNDPED